MKFVVFTCLLTVAGMRAIALEANCKVSQEGSLPKRLDVVLKRFSLSLKISGTLAVVTPQGAYIRGVGLANDRDKTANGPEVVYPIAANSQHFVAISILKLQEKGLLKVTDPMAPFFSQYRLNFLQGSSGAQIKIEHLLNHTSGIAEVYSEQIERNITKGAVSFAEFMEEIKNKPLKSLPGSKYEYSKTNYLILGEIVRRKTNAPYGEFLKTEVFAPLGLEKKIFVGTPPPSVVVAKSYGLNPSKSTRVDYFQEHGIRAHPLTDIYTDGNISATAHSLAVWLLRLVSGSVISSELTLKIFTPQFDKNGYGFVIGKDGSDRKVYSHSGQWHGFTSSMDVYPEEQVAMVFMANQICEGRDCSDCERGFELFFKSLREEVMLCRMPFAYAGESR